MSKIKLLKWRRVELSLDVLDNDDAMLSSEQREQLLQRQLEIDKAKAEERKKGIDQ